MADRNLPCETNARWPGGRDIVCFSVSSDEITWYSSHGSVSKRLALFEPRSFYGQIEKCYNTALHNTECFGTTIRRHLKSSERGCHKPHAVYTQGYSELSAQLVVLLSHVSAAKRSHLQAATSVAGMCRVERNPLSPDVWILHFTQF
jgi:hypothetical protein